ncbi:MAG: hypothetical protein WC552_08995, partial [Candidatus Omnitrophota bacterium]
KGQPYTVHHRTIRQQLWQTMRIKRGDFTMPELMITVPGAAKDNVKKFVKRLAMHGIIHEKGHYVGGRPGEFKRFRLGIDTGPTLPCKCPNCRKCLTAVGCQKGKP